MSVMTKNPSRNRVEEERENGTYEAKKVKTEESRKEKMRNTFAVFSYIPLPYSFSLFPRFFHLVYRGFLPNLFP